MVRSELIFNYKIYRRFIENVEFQIPTEGIKMSQPRAKLPNSNIPPARPSRQNSNIPDDYPVRPSRQNSNIPDDYPVRPSSIRNNRADKPKNTKETYTTVLLALIYFLYGCGISIYGPLYPSEAHRNCIASYIYGSVIAVSHLVSILFYPIACRMVVSISCRQSLSMGIFMIGACRVLFGTLSLMPTDAYFTAFSFAIQIVEGIGTSVLLASTFVTIASQNMEWKEKNITGIHASLALGIILGPIAAEAVKQVLGFSVPFYGIGGLTILAVICVATMMPEPGQRISYKEMPVISWLIEMRLLIYFFIIFATFNYTGFLTVTLEHLLRQFDMNSLYFAMMFSIAPFVYTLTAPGWLWLTKAGFNSLLLICVGSILIFASLTLIGPGQFTIWEQSLTYTSVALLLKGLGTAAKLSCARYAVYRDLRSERSLNTAYDILLIPTIFTMGSLFGYCTGSAVAGLTNYYIGFEKSTFVLFGLEAIAATVAFIFAFKRNYKAPVSQELQGEQQHILRS